ncbi:MAG: hypothetical protein ABI871_03290 [Chthoniobacterales bacterium]
MNSLVDAPPPQRGMGCFAKGCLTLLALMILLGAAFVGGSYWAVRHLRERYSAPGSAPLPALALAPNRVEQVQAQWEVFTAAADQHRRARIELNAGEVNALIASEPEWRGKAFVSMEGNVVHARLSIPIAAVAWLKGRYLNGSCNVRPSSDRKPANGKISDITLMGKGVSDDVLDYEMFGWKSIRRVIADWCAEYDISVFDIVDGKVVLETRGRE